MKLWDLGDTGDLGLKKPFKLGRPVARDYLIGHPRVLHMVVSQN